MFDIEIKLIAIARKKIILIDSGINCPVKIKVMDTVEIEVERVYEKMDVSSEAYITRMVDTAVKNLGHEIEHQTSGGGCDANYFNNMGIECVNLGTGMYELHTVNEYVIMDEFYRSADIVLETIQLNTA